MLEGKQDPSAVEASSNVAKLMCFWHHLLNSPKSLAAPGGWTQPAFGAIARGLWQPSSQFAHPKYCWMRSFSFNGGKSTAAWDRSSSGELPSRPILCPRSLPSAKQTSAVFMPKEKPKRIDLSRNVASETKWSRRCGHAWARLWVPSARILSAGVWPHKMG